MNNLASATILAVDDVNTNLDILVNTLGNRYDLLVTTTGAGALQLAAEDPPDLILLDVMMPGMDGFTVLQKLKENPRTRDIPVILLTALTEVGSKIQGLQMGAVDYITKPFQIEEVFARVDTHLKLRQAQRALQVMNTELQSLVARQVEEITHSQQATIFALAKLSHTRDDDTGLHLERVRSFCRLIAQALAELPGCREIVTPAYIDAIYHASPLHDVGKVGIEDSILLKPAKLTEEEFAVMQRHTTIGAVTLESVHKLYPNNTFIEMGIEIARHHHEKWNGRGYPDGLAGEDIPLSARIMALADVYDALRSRRPYKAPFSHERAMQIIGEEGGRLLDPVIVEVFMTRQEEFAKVFSQLDDIAGDS